MAFVVEPGVQVILAWSDASGHRSTESYWMDSGETDPSTGGPAAVAAAAQGISADALVSVSCRIRASDPAPAAPTDGPYSRGADKGAFVFGAADGSPVNLKLGAPNETIFESDRTTIDTTDAAVIALVAAMKLNACTAEGQAITSLSRGNRMRPPRRKGL